MASPAAASYLVEIADPPVPSRTTPVQKKSLAENLKHIAHVLGLSSILCVGSWLLLSYGYLLYGVVSGGLGVLSIFAAFGGAKNKAACPYCGASIDIQSYHKEGTQIQCEKCHEYSQRNVSLLRALDPATTSETPKFESPVFKNSLWPKACVACGEPPVRFDDLSKTTVGALPALVGHLQIIRGSVKGLPYCDKHRDKLSLKVGSEKKLLLCWTSLRMMRRYLAANRNRPAY